MADSKLNEERGMIWEIIEGDCIDIMSKMDNGIVDLTVTSPPYDNMRNYGQSAFSWGESIWKPILKEIHRITKQGGVLVWVVGDATIKGCETGTSFKQALYAIEIGFNLHDTMIYKKNGTGACGSNLCYWQTFEYMFIFSKGTPNTVNRLTNEKPRTKGGVKTGRITKNGVQKIECRSDAGEKKQIRNNIWEYNVGFCSGDDKTEHPAVFPEQLAEDHILSWSKKGDLIFDPFTGSGTTGKMAVINERNFIGIEREPFYFDIACNRIDKVTPNQPRVNG